MKKVIKYILLGLALFIIGVIIAATFSKSEYHIEEKITINASDSLIYTKIVNLSNWKEWDPWYPKDPEMKEELFGPEMGIGTKRCWDSQKEDVGKGCLEIVESVVNKSTKMDLTFPDWNMRADIYFFLNAKDQGVEVTWVDDYKADFGSKVFFLFTDVEKDIRTQYQEGLTKLKKVCEK